MPPPMALCEICVHVLSARDVKRPNAHSQVHHKAVIALPGLNRVSHQTKRSDRPDDPKWDQKFIFNVPVSRLKPDKVVNVKIFGESDWYCGQANVPILGVKDDLPHRYPLTDEGGNHHGVVKIGVSVKTIGGPAPPASTPQSATSERSSAASSYSRPKSSHSSRVAPQPQANMNGSGPGAGGRPALTVMTLESEVKRPSTAKAGKPQVVQVAPPPTITIQPAQRQSLAGAGRSQSMHHSRAPPTIYVQPANTPKDSNSISVSTTSTRTETSSKGSFPAPYITPSMPAPSPTASYGPPPPGPGAPYGIPTPYGAPPPYAAPPPPQQHWSHAPVMTQQYGGFGSIQAPVIVRQPRSSGMGSMMMGAAVGAGVGILGGIAATEIVDEVFSDDDDDDDFF